MAGEVAAKSRRNEVSDHTAAEHDALLAATHHLERALARPARGREGPWGEAVIGALRGLSDALARHRDSAEADDGLLAELLGEMPEAAFRIGRLRDGHRAMLDETAGLIGDLERANSGGVLPVDAARRRAAHLLTALRAHQAEQVDLIFEAFDRDIGASD